MSHLKEGPLQTSRFDCLKFTEPAATLVKRIKATRCSAVGSKFDAETTDVFGLFGPWGSGKSSLLAMVRESCEKTVTWLEFDALKYQTDAQALIPLLHHMAKECGSQDAARFFRGLVKSVGRFVSDVIVASTAGSIAKEVGSLIASLREVPTTEKELSETLPESRAHAIADAFDKLTKELRKTHGKDRIVIAIDNLDRCRPPALLEMLEAIHLLLGASNVTFILAIDQAICIRSIAHKYGYSSSDAALYLEKMIPDYYRIPDPWVGASYSAEAAGDDAILGFLRNQLTAPECEPFKEYERMLWGVIGSTTILRNPRRIKRLFRRIALLPTDWFKEHKSEFLALIFVVTLSDVWPELFFAIPYTEPGAWKEFIGKTSEGKPPSGPLSKLVDGAFEEFILALRTWNDDDKDRDAPGFSVIAKYGALDELVGEIRKRGI